MDTTQLDRMIIENLEDLDAVVHRVHAIEEVIKKHLAEESRRWAAKRGWRFSALEDDEIWVAPPEWQARGRDIWFELGWGPDDNDTGEPGELWFDLCRWAGVGRGRLCLWLDWRGAGIPAWKATAGAHLDEMKQAGLLVTDGRLIPYVDCTPDSTLVAKGLVEGDLSEAYAPFRKALATAAAAVPILDPIMKKAAR
jgi:hypothetical protein